MTLTSPVNTQAGDTKVNRADTSKVMICSGGRSLHCFMDEIYTSHTNTAY